MRTISKLAHLGTPGTRSPFTGVFDHVRRALSAAAERRPLLRPLQDIDEWSHHSEVAYYEDGRFGRAI